MTVERANALRASMHSSRRAIKGWQSEEGGQSKVYHKGVFLRMQAAAPPPVAEYDHWLAGMASSDPRGKSAMTGAKLRCAVVMVRQGGLQKSISTALGVSQACVSKWLALLPPELAA